MGKDPADDAPQPRQTAPEHRGHSYARLEQRLVLLSWLHDLLGYADHQAAARRHTSGQGRVRRGRAQLRPSTVGVAGRAEGSNGRPGTVRQQHPGAPGRYERWPEPTHHAALLPVPGRALHGDVPRPVRQEPGHASPFVEQARRQAQLQPTRQRSCGPIRGVGPEEAGLLDGDGQRQDPADAPELPAVPPLQPGAVGQHPADHAQRGAQPAAPGRAAGVRHPGPALRPERERAFWGGSEHAQGDRDNQAGDGEARRGERRCTWRYSRAAT